MSCARAHCGMTGKTIPLYVVCSPCRSVGKTLISRLLTEFYVIKDCPVAAVDLADEGPQLADYLPKFATIADIGDIRGQMALFDRLIAKRDIPTVIDVSHRAFKNFFTIVRDISFFDEARRRSIAPLILFIIDPNATKAYGMLSRQFNQTSLIGSNLSDQMLCSVAESITWIVIRRRVPAFRTLPVTMYWALSFFPIVRMLSVEFRNAKAEL